MAAGRTDRWSVQADTVSHGICEAFVAQPPHGRWIIGSGQQSTVTGDMQFVERAVVAKVWGRDVPLCAKEQAAAR